MRAQRPYVVLFDLVLDSDNTSQEMMKDIVQGKTFRKSESNDLIVRYLL